jgi:uncharacterized RDD family membrane protein YckC
MGSALLDTTPLDPASFEAVGNSHAAATNSAPTLRLQVAERIAAHRDRRGRLHPRPPADAGPAPSAATRSARIAASVAERFAQSPSYRAFLAAEAERATQQAQAAAEIAALNAQAVAHAEQQLLESLYPPTSNDQAIAKEPELTPTTDSAASFMAVSSPWVGDRADAQPSSGRAAARARSAKRPNPPSPAAAPGLTVRPFDEAPPGRPVPHAPSVSTLSAKHTYEDEAEARALDDEIAFRHAPVFEESAGPPMPLPANLIEFPRQLIAPRKARPRYAEGPLREDGTPEPGGSQLRIFEVDAAQISTTPGLVETPTPQWISLWLDAPHPGPRTAADFAQPDTTEFTPETWESNRQAQTSDVAIQIKQRPQTAPVSRRLMAAAIDGGFILAGSLIFASTVELATLHAAMNPSGERLHLLLSTTSAFLTGHAGLEPGVALAASAAAIAFLYLLYQVLFFSLSDATPGMRIARIALCTFSDENPTRPAMRRRIFAVLLSACTLGLGFLWAALDEDHLTWHDLITRMYQRSY